MKNEYLTIKEAAAKYKKGSSTITRFVREHQKTKFVKKEKGRFLVSDSLLSSNFEKVETHEHLEIQTSNQSEPKKEIEKEKIGSELVHALKSENEFLRSQISKKDSQIDKKDSQIENLLQRQFEQNSIIQTMQNRFDLIGTKIDSSVLLLSEKVNENKPIPPGRNDNEKGNDNGFTIASAIMIILLVVAIIVFLIMK
jgi:hypothetical protein